MKTFHINCNSIRNKLDDIQILLQKPNNGSLACTETKLDSHRDSNNQFKISNYHKVRIDSTSNKVGGTIVYIHSNIKYEKIETPSENLPKQCESITIQIRLQI